MDSILNNLKPEIKEETEEEKIDIVPLTSACSTCQREKV
jgi:hypothetical protein